MLLSDGVVMRQEASKLEMRERTAAALGHGVVVVVVAVVGGIT